MFIRENEIHRGHRRMLTNEFLEYGGTGLSYKVLDQKTIKKLIKAILHFTKIQLYSENIYRSIRKIAYLLLDAEKADIPCIL